MNMETKRLELIPPTLENLELLNENLEEFESKYALSYQGEELTGFIKEYLQEQIRLIKEEPKRCLYMGFWLLLRKEDRVVVGSAAFKGLPDDQGEIELGYGLGKAFEHNGYMTEAVAKICEWAYAQEGVKHVIAETDLDGFASMRILERNGFKRYRFDDASWWRL